MRKRGKKLLAMMLAMSMTMNMVSMQAFADEPVVETETQGPVDNGDGTETGTTITTTTTTDSETGNVTVNVVIEKEVTDTNKDTNSDDGVDVSGESTREEETITDEDGKLVEESWVEDGTEKKEWTEEDAGDGEQEEVEVPLVAGEKTEATDIDEETTGDVNSQDGQTTTTTTDRTVTAETSEVQVSENYPNDGLVEEQDTKLNGVLPVYDVIDGKKEDKKDVIDRNYLSGTGSYSDTSKWDMPEDADFRYVGTGEHNMFFYSMVEVVYKKDPNTGETIYENGEPVVDKLLRVEDGKEVTVNGEAAKEILPFYMYDNVTSNRPRNFLLMDEKGNKVVAYCCDHETDANKGTYYKVSNLEDSDYYVSEESEQHIRSIVMNGYWGTSDIPDQEGNYELGSLERMKASIKKAVEEGKLDEFVPLYEHEANGKYILDENGERKVSKTVSILDIIDDMTEGEAMMATQVAIWSYSNGAYGVTNGKDAILAAGVDHFANYNPATKKLEEGIRTVEGGARLEFIYNWLMNLEDTEAKSTVVVNEKNFVEDMGLTVKDKDTNHENNKDDNKDNDVYNTDLNFKLAFVPGEKDDLLVQITYKDLDGNDVNVVRRLAGTNQNGEYYETIIPDANDVYVIKDLVLSENEDFHFDLRLEGTQYLENGVYIYEAVGGRKQSQTFVSVAEGERNVDVSLGVTIKFDVDEDNHVVAERTWHDEGSYKPKPSGGNNNDDDDNGGGGSTTTTTTIPDPVVPLAAADTIEISDGDVPLSDGAVLNIEDAPIPLAVLPMTGDVSVIWMLLSLISGLGLAGVSLADWKKRR